MATNLKGPAIYLAQFAGDSSPFNSWDTITKWAAGHGFKGVQLPSWDGRLIDLEKAASSKTYCDELAGIARANGVEITELGTHLQGQLVAVHPAYDEAFDAFAPEAVKRNPKARQHWAVQQMLWSAKASKHLGLKSNVSFPGALAWPYLYPWPQRPPGLIEAAFDELAKRWRPIFDAFDEAGCNVAFELHPGEDLFDGATFEMFLERVDNHPRCCINYDPSHFLLQQLDYLAFIDIYHQRISSLHIKDAEFRPDGRQGRVFGLPALAAARRALPLAGRRADRLPRHLLEDGAVRLRRLGRARMGVLPEAPGAGRGRRRGLHPRPHHPRHREGLRRLCRWRQRPGAAQAHARSLMRRAAMAIEASKSAAAAPARIRLGMVGGGEGAFIGAVHRIAARLDDHYELVAGALSVQRRQGPTLRAGAGPGRPSASMPTTPPWRRPKPRAPTASRRWPSSRPTTCMRRWPKPS